MVALARVVILNAVVHLIACAANSESKGPKFVEEPSAGLDFSNNVGGLLNCVATGSPQPIVTWHFADGSPVFPITNIREVTSNGSLFFPPFAAENYRQDVHEATYHCEATNLVGRIISIDASVRAIVQEHYDVMVRDALTIIGNTAILRCETPAYVRDVITVTSWYKGANFNIFPTVSSDGKYHMLPTGELLVYNVTTMDALSRFRCRTINSITGGTTESRNAGKINIQKDKEKSPPRIVDFLVPKPVLEGETAVLTCLSQGNPPPKYRWYKGDQRVVNSNRFKPREGVMVIQRTQMSDAGQYFCESNSTLGSKKNSMTLVIRQRLAVQVTPSKVHAQLKKEVKLVCTVSGYPTATITWLKDGVETVHNFTQHIKDGEVISILLVPEMNLYDHGMYQCVVRNDFEMAQSTAEVLLGESPPQILYRFIDQIMQPGPAVSLKCVATAKPTAVISWYMDGSPIVVSDRLLVGQFLTVQGDVVSHVNITNLRLEDGAEYKCVANNILGMADHAARLNVYGPPMVRPMRNIVAVAGSELIIYCPVSGYPIASITWRKDGQLLPINRQQRVTNNGVLIIKNVDRNSVKGKYKCTARNNRGVEDSETVDIDVKVPPKIENFSFPTDIHEESRVLVTCVLRSGDLPVRLKWSFNGGPTLPSGVTTYAHGEDDLSLRIPSVAAHHAGNYTCVATNVAATMQHTATLIVHVPPRIAPFSFNKHLSEGVRAHVSCVIEKGDPPFTIKWFKDGQPLEADSLKIIGLDTHSSTIVIESLEARHSGNYTCQVKNEVATTEQTAELFVSVPTHWALEPKDEQAQLGTENYRLDCIADGNPAPTVSWRRGIGKQPGDYQDLPQQEQGSGINIFPNGTIFFDKIEEVHEGYYLCEASNEIGPMLSKRIFLTVNAPPHFPTQTLSQTVRLGTSASLQCEAHGDPPISIKWRKNGALLDTGNLDYRANIKETMISGGVISQLEIKTTIREDSGEYICYGSNPFGRDEMTVNLTLQQPPEAPRNLHVIQKNSRSIMLGWQASHNEVITQCIVEHKIDTDSWAEKGKQHAFSGTSVSAMITDLRPATTYHFRVSLDNNIGRSSPSEEFEVVTDGEVPSAVPKNVRGTATSSTTIHVQWEPPDRDTWNGIILGYHLGFKVHGDGRDIINQFNFLTVNLKSEPMTEATLLKLKKFTKYEVTVQPFNSLGPGPTSAAILVATDEDVPSAPPQDVQCFSSSPHSLLVSWQHVPESLLNGYLKGYKIILERGAEANAGHGPVEKITTLAQNALIEGLETHTEYIVRALAFTRVGNGVLSPPLRCMTKEDIPEAPSAIKAVVNSPTSIILSWLSPLRVNGILTGYTVYLRTVGGPNAGNTTRRHALSAGTTSYLEENLHKKGRYEFAVSATTRAGEGPKSSLVTISTSSEVRAATYSFSISLEVPCKADVTLPCLFVGRPEPTITWRLYNNPIQTNDRVKIQKNGALLLKNVAGDDSGNYSCHVENRHGSDSVTHRLVVEGRGDKSSVRTVSTDGGEPSDKAHESIVVPSATFATIHLEKWLDNGCPILFFDIEYRIITDTNWKLAANNVAGNTQYVLGNLNPGTAYCARVSANSHGGFTSVEYYFTTAQLNTAGSITGRGGILANWQIIIAMIGAVVVFPGGAYCIYRCCKKRARTRRDVGVDDGPHISVPMDDAPSFPTLRDRSPNALAGKGLPGVHTHLSGSEAGATTTRTTSSNTVPPSKNRTLRGFRRGYDIEAQTSDQGTGSGTSRRGVSSDIPPPPNPPTSFKYKGGEKTSMAKTTGGRVKTGKRRRNDGEEQEYDSLGSEDDISHATHLKCHRSHLELSGRRILQVYDQRPQRSHHHQTMDHRSGSHLSRRSRYNSGNSLMPSSATLNFKHKPLSRRGHYGLEMCHLHQAPAVINPPHGFVDEDEEIADPPRSYCKIDNDFTITV